MRSGPRNNRARPLGHASRSNAPESGIVGGKTSWLGLPRKRRSGCVARVALASAVAHRRGPAIRFNLRRSRSRGLWSNACSKTLVVDRGSCERHRTRVQSIGLAGRGHLNPPPWTICLAIAILVSLFSVRGVAADFNGDGKSDILWRKTSTGSVSIWLMNGGSIQSQGGTGIVSDSWVIQGVGDFNGDRKTDVLWRNTSTGVVTIWFMNGGVIQSQSGSWTVSSDWVIQGVGDFNGDDKADILWRQRSLGIRRSG